ncbi:GspE/PulE family protein [Thalassoglobus polymorphus]|uniref:Type II secretion system protein E n=1 Tax=Thalassoglobus polymorphus TaxID=2527994 RepID=A0A517QIV1_9PLAN|nr:ATPase, T2SS/T4P/T4SS family [Thalassoglobus polymorphus]QDT31569.1 Type II secretion system protein E [Thalassoglobus polymorphus]
MIFGFGKGGRDHDDDDDDEEEDELDFILFKGAMNENNPDLSANGRLVQAGLIPAKKLISEALARRADTIRIEPKGKVAAVSYLVDGVPYPAAKMPPKAANAVIQMLKLLAGLDITDKTSKQGGGINAEFDEVEHEVRIDVSPVKTGGERLLVRVQNLKEKLETPSDLGFSDDLQQKIREIGGSKTGLMLAAGMPMSGTTTLTIAMIRGIDPYLYSLASIADMHGRDLPHIQDFKWNEGDDLEATIKRTVRADIDVLFVDPIASAEELKVVLEGAASQAFISEIPARDAADGIARAVALTKDPKLVTAGLRLVISQKLVRLLCRKCRHAYRPNPKLLSKVGLPKETRKLYRAPRFDEEDDEEEDVCDHCGGTGYRGRIGLIEMIELTDDIKKLILAGTDAATLRKKAREAGMQSFQSDGIRLVAEGKTSLEELQRAFRA